MFSLDNKSILIIGATSGIGYEVSKSFIDAGAKVIMAGRRDTGTALAESIDAHYIKCDVGQEQSVENCFQQADTLLGKLDVMVFNAGIADDEGSIEDYDSSAMLNMVNTNYNGCFYVLKYAPSHLNDNGSIITTGSAAGSGITHAGAAVYSSSKAAVAYLTRTSALENAPRGIRVNTICPALIAGTGMMTEDNDSEKSKFLSQLNAFGRMGRIDEVIGIYHFLASDASSFITGQEIKVDGGLTAGIGLPVFSAVAESISTQ